MSPLLSITETKKLWIVKWPCAVYFSNSLIIHAATSNKWGIFGSHAWTLIPSEHSDENLEGFDPNLESWNRQRLLTVILICHYWLFPVFFHQFCLIFKVLFNGIYRGYYTVARRYEFYVRVARTISHSFAALTREILFLPREHKIHIFEPTCNVLFIIWRNQFNKSNRRESWRHWTIRHSQRWHTENTPLGSRMKWRMESTSGLVPSKTLSSI